jgi:hypothetical protein
MCTLQFCLTERTEVRYVHFCSCSLDTFRQIPVSGRKPSGISERHTGVSAKYVHSLYAEFLCSTSHSLSVILHSCFVFHQQVPPWATRSSSPGVLLSGTLTRYRMPLLIIMGGYHCPIRLKVHNLANRYSHIRMQSSADCPRSC